MSDSACLVPAPPPPTKPRYIHATAVLIGEAGLLIRGPSRSGKSSLALALLEQATQYALSGKLIGDDRVSIERRNDALILRGHPAVSGKIEKREDGFADVPCILDVPWAAYGAACCVIDLEPRQEAASVPRLRRTRIKGTDLPLLILPFGSPRATLVMNFLQTGSM